MLPTVVQMSASQYHALPQISRSQADDYRESSWGYFMKHVAKDPDWQTNVTKDMEDGTLLHSLVLEFPDLIHQSPQSFSDVAVYPREVLDKSGGCRGNACKDWELLNTGKILKKQHELAEVWRWAQQLTKGLPGSYLDHPRRKIEQTILWRHLHSDGTPMDLRARLDLVIPGERIVDVKTCAKGDINDMENVIARSGYDFQAAWYQMAWESVTTERLPFTFVFIEKPKPNRTSVWTMDQDWVDEFRDIVADTLNDMKASADRGDWRDPLSSIEMTAYKPKWREYQYKKVGAE